MAHNQSRWQPQRPQRASARRKCLINPQKLFDVLRNIWSRRSTRAQNSIFSYLETPTTSSTAWCGFTGINMPHLLAHVASHHGGNYLLQPGLRDNYKLAYAHRREHRAPAYELWSDKLLNKGRRLSSGCLTMRDAVMEYKSMSAMVENKLTTVPVGKSLDEPALIGDDSVKVHFKMEFNADPERVSKQDKIYLYKLPVINEC